MRAWVRMAMNMIVGYGELKKRKQKQDSDRKSCVFTSFIAHVYKFMINKRDVKTITCGQCTANCCFGLSATVTDLTARQEAVDERLITG
jgi:hypothetical protein